MPPSSGVLSRPPAQRFRRAVLRAHAHVAEVGNRPRADPEGDCTPPGGARLQVIHDQGGLLLAVDVEARLLPAHLDPDPGPHAGNEIDVRLVLLRRLLTEALPG